MNDVRKKWILTAILAVIEILMTVTDLGYFVIGSSAFTVLHIPVFIAVILAGLPQGFLIAGIFGLSSMINAYVFNDSLLGYLFQDPRISVVPRLMIPFAVWLAYKVICYIADDHTLSARLICSGFAAVDGVIANAVFVIFSIAILDPEAIGITDSLSTSTIVVTNIIAINIFCEIIAAVAVTSLTVLILHRIGWLGLVLTADGKIAGADGAAEAAAGEAAAGAAAYAGGEAAGANAALIAAGSGSEEAPVIGKPIKKTFRKWLLLFMVLTAFLMFVFMYHLFTKQDRQNAENLLSEKSGDISRLVRDFEDSIYKLGLTIGRSGYAVIAEDDVILATGLRSLEVERLSDLAEAYETYPRDEICSMRVNGIPGSGIISSVNEYTVLSFLPDSEIYSERDRTLGLLLAGLFFLFLILFEMISVLVQHNVVHRIQDVNESLSQIRAGNLNERVTATGNTEFDELSLGINTTVDALKDTMREIDAKNRAELQFAKEVQTAVLPSGSLTGRGKLGFTIVGSMEPAREVGGDFYDYFLIGEDKMGFMIADVSGKGVPAALFMMRAMTLVSNHVLEGDSPAEALQRANVELCENNEKGMFVTLWLGILDLQTGTLEFANAAHNPPAFKKDGEPFIFMDHRTYRRGLVLAGLPETKYRNNVIALDHGDMLFLYTDGVTEAANPKLELYGEERLLACLTENYSLEPEKLIRAVRADIDAFAAGAEQYDDITILVLKMA